jgi:hypothetical protein
MLTEMRRPIPPGFWPLERRTPLPAGSGDPRLNRRARVHRDVRGRPGSYDLQEHARQLADKLGTPRSARTPSSPAATPLMLGGVSDTPRRPAQARRAAGARAPPGRRGGGDVSRPEGAPALRQRRRPRRRADSRGDVSAMGLGTATYVDGAGKVAGFGHPMLNGGRRGPSRRASAACCGSTPARRRRTRSASAHARWDARPGPADRDRPRRERRRADHPHRRGRGGRRRCAIKTHWHFGDHRRQVHGPGLAAVGPRVGHRGDVERAARPDVEADDQGRRRRGMGWSIWKTSASPAADARTPTSGSARRSSTRWATSSATRGSTPASAASRPASR